MFASAKSNGGFFKPADFLSAVGIVFEPTEVREGVVTSFKDNNGDTVIQDQVIADVTVFRTQQDLDLGEPQVFPGVTIGNKVLVNSLRNFVGKMTLNQLVKIKNYFAFEDVSPAVTEVAAKYIEKRNADRDAAANEMAALLG